MDYSIFDAFFEGVQVVSPEYRYLYVNKKVAEQANRKPEELLGRIMVEEFPGIEQSRVFSELNACLEDGEFRRFINEFTYPDGQVSFFELKIQRIEGGVMILSQDISERKREEYQLRTENLELLSEVENQASELSEQKEQLEKALAEVSVFESRFKSIIDNTREAILLLSLDQRVLYLNESLKGYLMTLIGKYPSVGELYEPYVKDFLKAPYLEALATAARGEVFESRRFIESTAGNFWFDFRFFPAYQEGEITGIIMFATNVTDEENSRLSMEQSEGKFRSLVESSLVGVYIVQGDRLVYANPRLSDMFGYTESEALVGFELTQVIHPDDLPIVRENIRKRLSGEIDVIRYQARGIHKSGQTFWFEVLGSVSQFMGKPAIIGTIRDITAEKEHQSHIQDLLLRLEELSFITSHELRHSHSQLLGIVQLLQGLDDVDAELKGVLKKSEDIFTTMDQSIHKLHSHVHDSRSKIK